MQPHVPLNHWPTVCLEAVFLHVLFCPSKDPCKCHKYMGSCRYLVSNMLCQYFFNQAWAPFFHQCRAYIVHNTSVLYVDSMSRLNVVLTILGTIIWSLEPCRIQRSICWPRHVKLGMLTLAMSYLLLLKANSVACSTIGSNSTETLINLIDNLIIFCSLW